MQKCVTEEQRTQFILSTISDHESNPMFYTGRDAGLYYRHQNPDIEAVKKIIYDRKGQAYVDKDSKSNHKIKANLFFVLVNQLIAYQLGNGISFEDEKIKESLGGSEFDFEIQKALAYAMCDGEAYAYVQEGKITPLCYACKIDGNEPLLVPLKDEDDGEIKAAIRYWRLTPNHPLRATLFELDGVTEYKEIDDKALAPMGEKKPYSGVTTSNAIEGTYRREAKNFDRFPIVTLRYINGQSELEGNRQLLFAYDLVYSAMVNGVDANKFYWIIRNADGMSDKDDLNFVADIMRKNVLHVPDDADVSKEELPDSQDTYSKTIAELRELIFENFMGVDVKRQLAGNVTTVEIKAAYENLNLKCDMLENPLSKFIKGILKVLGLDEKAVYHYKRANNINTTEFVTMLTNIAPILGDDTALKLICETLGLIDEYEKIKAQREAEAMAQMNLIQQQAQNTPTTEE